MFIPKYKNIFSTNLGSFFLVFLSSTLVRFLSNLIVVYVLSPKDFSISGMLVSIIYVFSLVSDSGVRPFLLRYKKKITKPLIDTIWSVQIIRGFVLATILFLSSEKIAELVSIAELSEVLKVCCFLFLLDGFKSLANILCERENRIAKPLFIELLSLVTSKVILILCAFYFESYWAFVIGIYIEYFLNSVLSYVAFGRMSRSFSITLKYVSELWSLTRVIVPSSILTIIILQSDKFVLSNYLTTAQLGAYFLALSISRISETIVVRYCRRVLMPFMALNRRAQLAGDGGANVYNKKTPLVAAFSILIVASIFLSPWAVNLIYPSEFAEAGLILSCLLIHSFLLCFSTPSENWLLVLEYNAIVLQNNIARVVWIAMMIIPAYSLFGALGVVIAYSTRETIPIILSFVRLREFNQLRIEYELIPLSVALGIGGLIYLICNDQFKHYISPM